MKVRALSPRQFAAVAGSVAVLLLAFWAGGANAAPEATSQLPNGGPGGTARDDAIVASPPLGIPSIGVCCPGSTTTGLTTSGQGSVQGEGTAARDEAIAKAIADATDQAKAAAKAAGITLGPIVGMDVSASGYSYPYPVMEGGGPVSVGKASGTGVSTGIAEPDITGVATGGGSSAPGAPGATGPVQTYSSVTITWSIA
jgi:Protein of unknown function (DUF541)